MGRSEGDEGEESDETPPVDGLDGLNLSYLAESLRQGWNTVLLDKIASLLGDAGDPI